MGALDPILRSILPASVLERRSIGKRGALVSPDMTFAKTPYKQWSNELAVREGYNASEWVKACVDSIATPASGVPWRVSKFKTKEFDLPEAKARYEHELKAVPASERAQFMRSSEARRFLEPVQDHPLEILIEQPNKFISRQLMMERFIQHLLLVGNAFFHINRGASRGAPLELWPVDPDGMAVHPDKDKYISHYSFKKKDVEVDPIPVEDVLHVMLPDPADPFWGVSVLKAGARVIDTDVQAVEFNRISLANMATPTGILSFKQKLKRDEWIEAREQLADEYQGAKNAGRPMVMGNEAQWLQMSLSPQELNFIESRQMNRESIAALFRVSLAVLGIMHTGSGGSAGNSTTLEIRRWHWIDTIIPLMDRLQAAFNLRFTPEFGKDMILWYDTANVEALRQALYDKALAAKVFWSMGEPLNNLNDRFGFGLPAHREGGDMGWLPASAKSTKQAMAEAERAVQDAENPPEPVDPNNPEGGPGNTNTPPDGGNAVDDGSGNSNDQGSTNDNSAKSAELIEIERRWGFTAHDDLTS